MADPKDVYLQMTSNNRKLVGLILLFPVALFLFLYMWLWIILGASSDSAAHYTVADNQLVKVASDSGGAFAGPPMADILTLLIPIVLIICVGTTLLSVFRGKSMLLHLVGAEVCPDDQEHIQIYHAVENVALAAGLPTPQVYLINDKALNAFATGYSPKDAAITLTTGLVESLTPLELEAVIAHEMGHILNRDIRLNLFIITGIGLIGVIGEVILRSRFRNSRHRSRSSGKDGRAVLIMLAIGLALYLFRYLIAPFVRMAVSRTQEFQADATSAYLTRHPQALIEALSKIAGNPTATSLSKSSNLSSMCIFSPLMHVSHLLDTHPPIEDRIKRLEEMS